MSDYSLPELFAIGVLRAGICVFTIVVIALVAVLAMLLIGHPNPTVIGLVKTVFVALIDVINRFLWAI